MSQYWNLSIHKKFKQRSKYIIVDHQKRTIRFANCHSDIFPKLHTYSTLLHRMKYILFHTLNPVWLEPTVHGKSTDVIKPSGMFFLIFQCNTLLLSDRRKESFYISIDIYIAQIIL